jgi:hypothetical protein
MKTNTEQKTKVIFRNFGGETIALFPEELGSNDANTCLSYMHMGQHSAADLLCVICDSKPASKANQRELMRELQSIGYDLVIPKRHRFYEWNVKRQKQLEKVQL